MKKKICIVVGSRANYSSIKTAMRAINDHPQLELQLAVGASAILDRYGNVSELIEKDGFEITARYYMILEGENPLTMAKSTGLGLIELTSVFDKLQPDVVVTVGDRYETMATAIAAAYMNIPLAHTMGGEVSGTIDESIRHAVTKFANIHFPASKDAYDRIIRLGEPADTVFLVGCPRNDLVSQILAEPAEKHLGNLFGDGVGNSFDLSKPFALVSQHPVTTEFGEGEKQITSTLEAIKRIGIPAIVLWPNSDAGSDDISRGIRKWREKKLDQNMHFFKNLPNATYIHLMKKTACLVGNSSSGIREGAFIGTPVVNIGSRQTMRERGQNVIEVPHDTTAIENAIRKQIEVRSYPMDPIYGDGSAGKKIADVLAKLGKINVQKRITH